MKFLVQLGILGVFLILSACTLSPTATVSGSSKRYETHSDQMNAFVGASERELLSEWGQPEQVKQISATSKVYVYRMSNPYIIIGCTSVFQIDQSIVTKWGYKGCPIRFNKKDYKLIPKDTPVPNQTLDLSTLNE
jgi:hypothetical protein